MKLYLQTTTPLGAGHRQPGYLLGTSTAKKLHEVDESNTKLAKGVSAIELRNALTNLHLLGDHDPAADVRPAGKEPEPKLIAAFDIPEEAKQVLQTAGILTADQAMAYGRKHKGFKNIQGMTEQLEQLIKDTLKQHFKK